MGIDKFHTWLFSQFPKCYSVPKNGSFDILYIDINCLLHRIIASAYNDSMLIKKFFSYINFIMRCNKPLKKIIFAIDGPAPFAKIVLQRKRRLKSALNQNNDNILRAITPLHFTPGTEFMDNFPKILEPYLDKLAKKHNIEIEMLLGTGEAEFKLINHILLNAKHNESRLIVSTDADIILMLAAIYNNESLKNTFVSNIKYNISIDEILIRHQRKIKYIKPNNIGKNFAIASLLLGNDYLPKIAYINADKLWDSFAYACTFVSLGLYDKKTVINYDFLIHMMTYIISIMPKNIMTKINLTTYNEKLYENYIDGICWCIQLYINGICSQTSYMCHNTNMIHPYGLLLYLEYNKNKLINKCRDIAYVKQVPDYIYAFLVLPKISHHLLKQEILDKIGNKYDHLFGEESCNICNENSKAIKKLYSDIKNCTDEKHICELKKKIHPLITESSKHKKTHKDLNEQDINEIIDQI